MSIHKVYTDFCHPDVVRPNLETAGMERFTRDNQI